jgi:hypothetical protein
MLGGCQAAAQSFYNLHIVASQKRMRVESKPRKNLAPDDAILPHGQRLILLFVQKPPIYFLIFSAPKQIFQYSGSPVTFELLAGMNGSGTGRDLGDKLRRIGQILLSLHGSDLRIQAGSSECHPAVGCRRVRGVRLDSRLSQMRASKMAKKAFTVLICSVLEKRRSIEFKQVADQPRV